MYQLKEVLPIVLCHEAEESQEGPAEGVIAGVAIIGVPPSLYALVTLGAVPGDRMGTGFREGGKLQLGDRWGAPREKKSFSPQNKKVFHPCPWVFLTFPFIQVLGPNQPLFSNTPGAPFSICLAPLTQHHCCSHRARHPGRPPGNRSSL